MKRSLCGIVRYDSSPSGVRIALVHFKQRQVQCCRALRKSRHRHSMSVAVPMPVDMMIGFQYAPRAEQGIIHEFQNEAIFKPGTSTVSRKKVHRCRVGTASRKQSMPNHLAIRLNFGCQIPTE